MTPSTELELVLTAKTAELPGGLHVRRALPQARRRAVGPFVFVDQMGPATIAADRELTVLPHPHIGLATVTWLFEGEGLHRDSLGTVQSILPGEVNWMTAGRGIAHSERMRPRGSSTLFGVQTWVALPQHLEEMEPSFEHYPTGAVPLLEEGGVTIKLIAGALLGMASAVKTTSPMFYAEVRMETRAVLRIPPEYDERALYVIEGAVSLGDAVLRAGELGALAPGGEVLACASEPTLLMLLGGAPLDGPRHIHWNFVSSSRERLKQAADDWRHQRFTRIPGETAYIPLPEDGVEPVFYP